MKWSYCDTYKVRKKRANEHQRDQPDRIKQEWTYGRAREYSSTGTFTRSIRLCHQYTSGELIVDTSGQGRQEHIDDQNKWHIICVGYLGAGDWGFNSLPLPCILSRDTSCSIIGISFVLGFRTCLPVFLEIGVAIHSAWKIFHHCSLTDVYYRRLVNPSFQGFFFPTTNRLHLARDKVKLWKVFWTQESFHT